LLQVVTWSTWLTALLDVKAEDSTAITETTDTTSNNRETASDTSSEVQRTKKMMQVVEEASSLHNILNAASEYMMLPRRSESAAMEMAARREAERREAQKTAPYFVLLRAVGDLLMLPKDMLMDKSVRKEVCPTLDLIFIRRILFNFQPDEFSPDPISPALLGAINSEICVLLL
jgi:hypothetical protein